MDVLFAGVKADIISHDNGRQASALLVALQLSASGKDISSLVPTITSEILCRAAFNPVSKRLAFDCVKSSRLTADEWEAVCQGIAEDMRSPDPEVAAAGVSFVTALPSWRIGSFLSDYVRDVSHCIVHDHAPLRQAAVESLGSLLARDHVVTLCVSSVKLLEDVGLWWRQIAQSSLDASDEVSGAAFQAMGSLFSEFTSRRLSRLAGDKLVPTDSALAVRSHFVSAMVDFVWTKRNLLMARAQTLPLDCLRFAVFPLCYAARFVSQGKAQSAAHSTLSLLRNAPFSQPASSQEGSTDQAQAQRSLGVSDIVSFLLPFLSCSLDPSLVYEVSTQLLTLANLPGGKAEWSSAPVSALLSLWDRQEYHAGREAILKAAVSHLELLDLPLQVSLVPRLLAMVRNLRVEADRMHALACICRAALMADLFVKETARKGQRALKGGEGTVARMLQAGQEVKQKEKETEKEKKREKGAVATALFPEEMLACLVESTFQLAQPAAREEQQEGPETALKSSRSLAVAGIDGSVWAQTAMEVLEAWRSCLQWECGSGAASEGSGRTYALDCYLRLLVCLCQLYDSAGGVKSVQEGAGVEQVRAEQRLHALHRLLLDDLPLVKSPAMRVRLLWVLAEHLDLSTSNPVFADEPREPLNVLLACMRRILFNLDALSALKSPRLLDVQAVLVCSQHLGSRNARAASLVLRLLQEFLDSPLCDSVSRQQAKAVVQLLAHTHCFPQNAWAARVGSTGEYPFTHHKLSVQYNESAAAQDRKLEGLVRTAVRALWQKPSSSLRDAHRDCAEAEAAAGASGAGRGPVVLSGSSDPVMVEAEHLTAVTEHRLTLHMRVVNTSEVEVGRVDLQVGLTGALQFMDRAPRAVRQLAGLQAQEPVKADVTLTVTAFQRSALCVSVVHQLDALSYESLEQAQVAPGVEAQPSRPWQGQADPVVLRCCRPYVVPLTELLIAYPVTPVEFFRIVSGLPAMAEHAGRYQYPAEERSAALLGQEPGLRRLLAGLKALDGPALRARLHRVWQHTLRSTAGFQVAYMARTWFGDVLSLVVFGSSELGQDGGVGEESSSMLCRFVLRSSSARVLAQILADPQQWLDDLTAGAVRALSQEELRAERDEGRRRTREHLRLLKATAQGEELGRPAQDAEGEVAEEEVKRPEGVVIPEEQKALQLAVLQVWRTLRAQQQEVEGGRNGAGKGLALG